MENLFQNIPDLKQREQAMADNAHSVTEGKIKKGYTLPELSMFKEQMVTQSIQMNAKLDELKALSAPLKADIKELKSVLRDLCQKLRDKCEEIDGKIYQFADYDNGFMLLYNAAGEFQGSRKLLPTEKQSTITQISKTA